MSDNDNVSLETAESSDKTSADESCVVTNATVAIVKNKQRRLASIEKLRIALICRITDNYIYLGKPISYHAAQRKAAWTHRQTVRIVLGESYWHTVPWYWETHALFVNLMLVTAGFDSDYLLVIHFVSVDDPKVKKSMTLYSYKSRQLMENVPADFDDFCAKLVDVCKETASRKSEPNEPSPVVALFNYSKSNHEVLNLTEDDIDVKSALTSLLQKFGIMKDNKLCEVHAFDPYKIFPDYEFRRRHSLYRKTVINLERRLSNFPVTYDEHRELTDIIHETGTSDNEFREIVQKFATKYLPEARRW